jgi:hypothetical protein
MESPLVFLFDIAPQLDGHGAIPRMIRSPQREWLTHKVVRPKNQFRTENESGATAT